MANDEDFMYITATDPHGVELFKCKASQFTLKVNDEKTTWLLTAAVFDQVPYEDLDKRRR